MSWTEKYRPKNFEEVLGNPKAKEKVQSWLDGWMEGVPQKCLLLVGPPGTGKTTLAHLAAPYFSEFVELNASDKRSQAILQKTVGEASSSQSLFGSGYKLLILDEVDGIHGTEDRGGIRTINQILKDSKHPVIMMANDLYSKRITGLKTKCDLIKINKVHTNSITALLKRICVKEGVEFEEHVIRNLAKRSRGDLRSAINDLEVLASGNNSITSADLEILSEKDQVNNIFDSVRTVLKSKNPRRIRDALRLEADPAFILELVAENIPREYEQVEEIQNAYDMIADADLFLGRAFNTRNYGYWKYSYDLMGIGVALAKEKTYRKFTRYANSSTYAHLSRNRGKRDLRDRVATKMGEKLHTSQKVAIEQFPFFQILFQKDDIAYDLAQFFEFDDSEIKQFRTRKIKTPKKAKKKAKKVMKKKPDEKTKSKKTTVSPKKKKEIPKNKDIEKKPPQDKDKQASLFNF